MEKKIFGPRKRRTREHVIADLGVHHVEGFILAEGHTVQRVSSDYGYDLAMFTFDDKGYAESGLILLQVKASEKWATEGTRLPFDIDIRDYDLWIAEKMPIILVLFDAVKEHAFWLAVQQYFHEAERRRPKPGTKTVRLFVPMSQRLNRKGIAKICQLKQEIAASADGEQHEKN